MSGVLVTHPGRQHSFHLAYALQQAGLLNKLVASFYFKPEKSPFSLIKYMPGNCSGVVAELNKRSYDKLNPDKVEQFPFFELLRESAERLGIPFFPIDIYAVNQIHDWYVSTRLEYLKPEIVIGSETACYRTFRKAKELGMTTVLDVPSLHSSFINDLRARYKEFDSTFTDSKTYLKKEKAKLREYDYADYVICISQLAKSTVPDDLYDKKNISVINLGFDSEVFKPKKSYLDNPGLKIVYAGNISVRKGINVLIKSLQRIAKEDIELVLVGNIIDCDIKNVNGAFKLTHIPYCNHSELAEVYSKSDLFVLPTYMDGWGMVLIEAMSCGTPVITTENAGSKEAIKEGENGCIVPVADYKSLAQKISYFYNNPKEIERYGTSAAKTAKSYTWDNYNKNIASFISSIN